MNVLKTTIDLTYSLGLTFKERAMQVASERSQMRSKMKSPLRPQKMRTFQSESLEASFLRFCQLSTDTPDSLVSKAELDEVREQAANFIDSPEFTDSSAEADIMGEVLLDLCRPATIKASNKRVSLPPHLAGLCEEHLLTPDQEKLLFRRLNFLRFKASEILDLLTPGPIGQWNLERVRGLIRAADWYRDVIVKANVRLVISIVKKFVNPQCGFDDLLSDGIMALIRSVDKFDYQLGFRFSTYATQVVRRNSYRFVMDRQDERLKITNSIGEPGLDVAADEGGSTMSELRWNTLREHLRNYLDRLDKREKFIIRARFSLGGHRKIQTLQRLADKLKISKERVRQLEKRAMEKLQEMAALNPPEIVEL